MKHPWAAPAVVLLGAGCGAAPGAVADPPTVAQGGEPDAATPSETPASGAAPTSSPSEPADAGEGQEIACRVALLHPERGRTGPLAGLPMAIRTTHAVGTREEVLKLAKMRACAGVGIPADRCEDGLFDPSFKWCEGDPPRRRSTDPAPP